MQIFRALHNSGAVIDPTPRRDDPIDNVVSPPAVRVPNPVAAKGPSVMDLVQPRQAVADAARAPLPPYPDASIVPPQLSADEAAVYRCLLEVVAQRRLAGKRPRPLVVVTDIAKDYDHLAALAVLKELHRLGLVNLRAVVANLMPEDKRARFARGALDALGLSDVPVGRGTCGSTEAHAEHAYEFDCPFLAAASVPIEEGQTLLLRAYREAQWANEKVTLLCLSSLRDVHLLAQGHPQLIADTTAEVHMQGGNEVTDAGTLRADPQAANNRFDLASAHAWHFFLQQQAIASHTYTKVAAYSAQLPADLFRELAETGNPVGSHLRRVQTAQDVQFYLDSCDPRTRFTPHLDQAWFLRERSSWHAQPHAPDDPLPVGDAIIPYLTKVVVYDALAALGSAGKDAVEALGVFDGGARHTVGGAAAQHTLYGSAAHSGVHAESLTRTLRALLKGALWATPGTNAQPAG